MVQPGRAQGRSPEFDILSINIPLVDLHGKRCPDNKEAWFFQRWIGRKRIRNKFAGSEIVVETERMIGYVLSQRGRDK